MKKRVVSLRARRRHLAAFVMTLGCAERISPLRDAAPRDDVPSQVFDTTMFPTLDVAPMRADAVPVMPLDARCGGTAVSLSRRGANVIFVIDRSGSMVQATTDPGNVSKWTALNDSLRAVLPTLPDSLSVGLTFFPEVLAPNDGGVYTPSEICEVPTALALVPHPGQAAEILSAFARTSPGGPTPTAASLNLVRAWYQSAPDLGGDRYVILVTDGAPNCNLMADLSACRCTGGPGLCNPMTNSFAQINCLAAEPVLAELQRLARDDVHTFVIGLNGVQDFADVLNQMADAGGRARIGGPTDLYRFYAAATAAEMTRQLEGIREVVSTCTLRLDVLPPDPNLVDVRLDGFSFDHDARRINGWDWGDESHTQVVFYGDACTRVGNSTGGSRLIAAFGCPAPVPP